MAEVADTLHEGTCKFMKIFLLIVVGLKEASKKKSFGENQNTVYVKCVFFKSCHLLDN
jgi:hypothetical protein